MEELVKIRIGMPCILLAEVIIVNKRIAGRYDEDFLYTPF